MSQPQRPPHTICLRSTDATEVESGVFRWQLTSENRRTLVDRVLLASIELPLSQLSIEDTWNRVYLCERLRLEVGRRTVTVTEHAAPYDTRTPVVAQCVLPIHLNTITSVIHRNGRTLVSTEYPHGLSNAMFQWARDNEDSVMVICTSAGAVNLSEAWSADRFRADDESTFSIQGQALATVDEGYVWFASPATPSALASMISAKLSESPLGRRVSISFDAKACAFVVRTASYPDGADRLRLQVEGDQLAVVTGLARASREFMRNGRTSSTPSRPFVLDDAPGGDVAPLIVTASAVAMFGYATLRPGSYVPCQRVYSPSPPLKLPLEWDLQFARFTFPRRESEYGLVYTDPLGINRLLAITPGTFTAESLVNYLRTGLNESAHGHRFEVEFDDKRFRIACRTEAGMGLAFALHFTHPQSVDAVRLGFEDAVLEGADNYESSFEVHVPSTPFGPLENSYAIGEIPGKRSLSIRPVSTPNVICIVEEYDTVAGVMSLRCVSAVDGSHVAHAYRASSVVFVGTPGGVVESDKHKHEGIPKNINSVCVVLEGAESGLVTQLKVRIHERWAHEAVGKVVQLSRHVLPCSFCFNRGLERTIGGERLGFDERTIEWGIDGSVATRKLKLPPFIGARSYNLDHVDFILLRIREGKNSTNMTYETNGRSFSVFGKVCLNPIFRNERHLPVETGITGFGRFETITIELLNPDMSPYRSNGATWSMSLSMT